MKMLALAFDGSALGRRGHAGSQQGLSAPRGLQSSFQFSRQRSPFRKARAASWTRVLPNHEIFVGSQ